MTALLSNFTRTLKIAVRCISTRSFHALDVRARWSWSVQVRAHSSEPRSQLPVSITIQRMLEMPLVPADPRKTILSEKEEKRKQ